MKKMNLLAMEPLMRYRKVPKATDADRTLKRAFATLRSEDPGSTPLAFVKSRVEARAAQQQGEEHSPMKTLARTLGGYPRTVVTVAAAVVAFLFVTLVPFPYSTITGYEVSFSNLDPQTVAMANDVTAAVQALGYDNVSINFSQNGESFNYGLTNLPSYQAAREAAAAFRMVTGSAIEADIEPVVTEVSGSLYAQVREKLMTIEVSTEGDGTDAEVEAEIRDKLAAQGFTPRNVSVTTDEDGNRTITIEVEQ
jgi:hypothetical protein